MMKHVIHTTIVTENGIVTQIGKSQVCSPKPEFNGEKTRWYDDSKLIKKDK